MIHKIEIEGETIHLNKSKWFGWGVIFPLKNEDGTNNWHNILTGGSILKLTLVILLILLIFGAAMEYQSNMKTCNKAVSIVNHYKLWNSIFEPLNISDWDDSLNITIKGVVNNGGKG